MPRPVMRTLLPFLRCFTTKPTNSSRAPVASFLVMPVFSASSAATLDSGTVGVEGLVAIVEGSLDLSFRRRSLTPQGLRRRGTRLSTNRGLASPQSTKNVDFWGFFGHLGLPSTGCRERTTCQRPFYCRLSPLP